MDLLLGQLTYEEYLELPVGWPKDGEACPHCGGPHFGSVACDRWEINRVYVCHGNELTGAMSCGGMWRSPEPDLERKIYDPVWKAIKVFGAFLETFYG